MLIKCVTEITQDFKTAYILLDIWFFIANHWFKSNDL